VIRACLLSLSVLSFLVGSIFSLCLLFGFSLCLCLPFLSCFVLYSMGVIYRVLSSIALIFVFCEERGEWDIVSLIRQVTRICIMSSF
jgi:hypothetical protein